MATTITDEMCIESAVELAKCAEDKGLTPKYILPNMNEREVFPRQAVAVGMKAIEQKVARVKMSKEQLYEKASMMIDRARKEVELMMKSGIIPECKI
jgi:malate dehydrogenase (oxaloacetate-decarboxylating)